MIRIQATYLLLFLTVLSSCTGSKQITRFLVVPDTQTYLESHPEVMENQFDWIAKQRRKIDFVIHLGDVTQDNREVEWYVARKNFEKLKVPYSIALGNHDMGSKPGMFADTRESTLGNKYFPVPQTDSSFCFEKGKMDNRYHLLKTGKTEWLILSLAFGPSDKVLRWANKVVSENQDKKVILSTHAYLYLDSTRMGNGDWWRPQSYGIGKDTIDTVNDGEQIWQKLVSKHANIVAVFSGHVLKSGTGLLVSQGEKGNSVVQILTNFQRGVDNSIRGGNGYLRIVEIDTRKSLIDVKTFSTWEKKYHTGKPHNYSVDLNSGIVKQ
ncbi:MAG TPA: phosphoesterase [Prolixibacteraceae bacterium]|nr:phosphoesterase [Prolixibacteraceae bacterium]